MLTPLWTFLLVLINTCGDHQLGKHKKKQPLELISDLLGGSSKKPKAKALPTTTSGIETPLYFLLTLAGSMSLWHAQLADSSKHSFASKNSNSFGSSSSRTGTSIQTNPYIGFILVVAKKYANPPK